MKRLSQVLAVEKQAKNKANDLGSETLSLFKKQDMFTGWTKDFLPLNEDAEMLPSDNKPVIHSVTHKLHEWMKAYSELLDVTLTKDTGNLEAQGTITLGTKEVTLPVTYLIWLEKQVFDLKQVLEALPVLDNTKQWRKDEASGQWRTEPARTSRYKKKKVPLVKYPATDKHPAQVDVIEEDVLQGHWSAVFSSTAVPQSAKDDLVSKVESLLKQVKEAREEANSKKVEDKKISNLLLSWLFGE